jgi:delta 1-pyrroline-5-carboxylate dehydrogenase
MRIRRPVAFLQTVSPRHWHEPRALASHIGTQLGLSEGDILMAISRRTFSAALVAGAAAASLTSTRGMGATATPTKARNVVLVHGLFADGSSWSEAETNVRLQRAWDGWRHWSRTPLHERSGFLIRLADLLEARAETYGRLITAEMGKPLPDAIAEIKKSALDARHLAEIGKSYIEPQPIPGLSAKVTYELIEPVVSVQPWNLPFRQALRFFNTTALVGNPPLVRPSPAIPRARAQSPRLRRRRMYALSQRKRAGSRRDVRSQSRYQLFCRDR